MSTTRNEFEESVKLLVKAGVRQDQVKPLLQKLLQLTGNVTRPRSWPYGCEAEYRFDLERSWGG